MSRGEICWLMTLAFLIAMNVVNNPFTVAVCAGGSLFWLMRATFPAFDRFWSEP